MAECEGSEGESTPECEGSECEGSEGESTLEYEGSNIGNKDGLIDNEMGLSATEWAYRQRFLFWFGFGTIANDYQRRLPEPSRMVQRLGLGLGLDRCEWLSAMVWVLIGDGVGSYRRLFGSYW